MEIEWTQAETRYEYDYGTTGTRFSAQIGKSTNAGKYVWTIFHEDFNYCVFGGETGSHAEAMSQAVEWLNINMKITTE